MDSNSVYRVETPGVSTELRFAVLSLCTFFVHQREQRASCESDLIVNSIKARNPKAAIRLGYLGV